MRFHGRGALETRPARALRVWAEQKRQEAGPPAQAGPGRAGWAEQAASGRAASGEQAATRRPRRGRERAASRQQERRHASSRQLPTRAG